MYAGALGDNAVERYALFLTSLALSADPTERRTALQRAREHGLDVPRVAIVTAERTIERSLDNLPSSVKGPLPDLAKTALEPAEEAEILPVRSIKWTIVEEDTALEQTNVILRYLLCAYLLSCLSFLAMFYGADICLRCVSLRSDSEPQALLPTGRLPFASPRIADCGTRTECFLTRLCSLFYFPNFPVLSLVPLTLDSYPSVLRICGSPSALIVTRVYDLGYSDADFEQSGALHTGRATPRFCYLL
jgi:hypothetical protein